MGQLADKTVTVLGVNGRVGHEIARAFVAAGWVVRGFGRENRRPVEGMVFVAGDAGRTDDLRRAAGDSAVVINALNLAYDKWGDGRLETLYQRVIDAVRAPGRTLMLPGNIYNFAATDAVITPETREAPERSRGEIRMRCEAAMGAAAAAGDLQAIVIRAGDFFGPGSTGDWFDQAILREINKGKLAILGPKTVGHSWAYLPDLARAFVAVAEARATFSPYDRVHFAGHHVQHGVLMAAIQKAVQQPLRVVPTPWALFKFLGLFMPLMRDIVEMRYLYENDMRLEDPRLSALLGPNFDTPHDVAVSRTVLPFLN